MTRVRADARPVLLTAEAMFPWMFEEIRSLRPFAGAAEIFAAKDDWPASGPRGRGSPTSTSTTGCAPPRA